MDDEMIVGMFFARDQRAIEETDMKYGTKLHRFAMRILENYEDAEESRNDTYMKAWTTIPPQKPPHLYAYLAKICRFLAFGRIDWKNARKRQANVVALTKELEGSIPVSGVEKIVEAREIGRLLECFLRQLPQERRMIFMRRYWFAESIKEIAKRYDMPENTVKSELFRMRNKLKRYLEKEGIKI